MSEESFVGTAEGDSLFDARAFLQTVPERPGVYRMVAADGTALYVGKAKNLRRRLMSYFRRELPSPRIARMVEQVAKVEVTVVRSETEALILENHLIKSLQPKYNVLFRDDKSYPYLRVSGGDFPGIYYYRGPLRRGERYFGPYPNALAARESIRLVQQIFRLRTCEETVFANRSRACLLHQIGRCSAPCVGAVPQTVYEEQVKQAVRFLRGERSGLLAELTEAMEAASAEWDFERAASLRDQIRLLQGLRQNQAVDSRRDEDVDVFAGLVEGEIGVVTWAAVRGGRHLGDHSTVLPLADEDVKAEDLLVSFWERHYGEENARPERVVVTPWNSTLREWFEEFWEATREGEPPRVGAARGEIERAWVEMALANARVALGAYRARRAQGTGRGEALGRTLGEWLGWSEPPRWIECFDVSHLGGEEVVASCVVWADGQMQPRRYRRFHVRAAGGDDCAAIEEVVGRRYRTIAEEGGEMPDLVIVDGGVGQVRAAVAALTELGVVRETVVMGIAKGAERRPGLERLIRADGDERRLPPSDPALHLLQEIRDEAHRFAVRGSRARGVRARVRTELEEIAGVGPKRRRALLAVFGSMQEVAKASVAELTQVPGISRKVAEAIYAAFHGPRTEEELTEAASERDLVEGGR
ncbi:MAG: excinuclease ABC subunit UvrC [Hydrogenophilus sp.]|nr:excinuclease ABC subunit UvrC [Hydrogenophilus sp.]